MKFSPKYILFASKFGEKKQKILVEIDHQITSLHSIKFNNFWMLFRQNSSTNWTKSSIKIRFLFNIINGITHAESVSQNTCD